MNIATLELNGGEFVGIGVIEITSISTLTILKKAIRKVRYADIISNLASEELEPYCG